MYRVEWEVMSAIEQGETSTFWKVNEGWNFFWTEAQFATQWRETNLYTKTLTKIKSFTQNYTVTQF